jgi:hypothetical protein
MSRPPLDLYVEITSADGTRYRWDSDARKAADRPTGLTFSSARMEGFKTLGCDLARRVDQDFPDLHLWDDVVAAGADGAIAWQGRLSAAPRSLDTGHMVNVTGAGWASHMKDHKFRETYVDRDLSAWGPPSNARRAFLLAATKRIDDMSLPSDSSQQAIVTAFQGAWASPFEPQCEGWYDIGAGLSVGQVYVAPQLVANIATGDANWQWVIVATNDDGTSAPWAQVRPATGYFSPTAAYQLLGLQLRYNATPAGSADATYEVDWRSVTVYGAHGVPLIGDDPKGVAASDVLVDIISRFYPKISTAAIRQTTYPIGQLKFDSIFGYDAMLQVNGYHLWNFAVWEGPTAHYDPFDLTDYDWEVRLSDPGVKLQLQGPSTESLANGIEVTYTDALTGRPARLTPDDTPELADPDPTNEATRHGLTVWTSIDIGSRVPLEDAIQIGRAALAEYNQPKAPGTITVTGGYIRDRAGHWQQGWKVRGGDRVAITDHPNSRPRLITEAGWDHDSKTLTIATDSTLKRVDAILDRFGTALVAGGLA